LVKTGFTFVGWNTLAAGGGTRYLPGETLTATGNLTLYAEWIASCAPVVSYANGNQVLTITRTTPCAYTLPESATAIDLLVVGGGGGGGTNAGSGGGGGGVVYQRSVPIASGQVVMVLEVRFQLQVQHLLSRSAVQHLQLVVVREDLHILGVDYVQVLAPQVVLDRLQMVAEEVMAPVEPHKMDVLVRVEQLSPSLAPQ
jgi:uncharacterized repeat protein (TIGR02543 family)